MYTVIRLPFYTEGDWIDAKSGALPECGQICAGIYKYGPYSIGILQYREPDQIWDGCPYFLSLTDMWRQMVIDNPDVYNPTFASMEVLSYWMPLKLPEIIRRRIDNQIKQSYLCDEGDE